EVHAAHGIAVEVIRVTEGLPKIVDHHHGLRARVVLVALLRLADADEALLFRLAVGVLNEDGEQLQRVTLGARRSSQCGVHEIELGPGPTRDVPGFDVLAVKFPVNRRQFRTVNRRGQPWQSTRTGYIRSA